MGRVTERTLPQRRPRERVLRDAAKRAIDDTLAELPERTDGQRFRTVRLRYGVYGPDRRKGAVGDRNNSTVWRKKPKKQAIL